MSRTRRFVLALGAVALVMGVSAPAFANHCDSNRFCAFDLTSFGDPRLLSSSAGPGTDSVQVDNNRVSSAKNRTDNRWCGVEAEGWPDDTIFSFAPHSWYDTLGTANNKIDHFYVRSPGAQCD